MVRVSVMTGSEHNRYVGPNIGRLRPSITILAIPRGLSLVVRHERHLTESCPWILNEPESRG